ncbi:hypothetical protein V5O48_010478 [Marasmius crinis-equi]|uniref:Uncharacterized protein n=1 Tax=Marasmius crinis-equi TaxID=585013 RepID=A0ABR3F8F0_9AGAR
MTKWWTRTAPAPSASEDSRTAPPPMTTSAPEDSRVSRASLTFILFATTSAVALITPVLLSQAYRLENIFFPHSITGWVPDAVSFDKMRHVDGSDQMNMGINSWVYDNRAALSMDSNLLYKPVDVGAIARELFRTGDIGNGTVLDLDGLHLNVSCARISSPSLATGNLNTSWTTFCQSQISQFHGLPLVGRKGGKNSTDESGVPLLTEFSLYLCNNQTNAFPFLEGAQSQNTGYAYYTYTQVSKDRESATGLVQCNSTLTTGTVTAYGSNRTYTNFTPRWFLNSSNATQPILDPLFAVFGSLEKAEVDPVDTIFGTAYRGNRSEHPDFSDYISRRVAFSLTDAIITFTSALARLSRDTVLHEGHIPVPIGVYTRHNAFAVCAYVLLVLWVVLIAALSLWSYRRTFSEKLDSYVAAELAFQEGFDLEGSLPGGENEGCLNRPFAFPERGQGGRRQQVLQDGSTGGGKDRLSQG